MNLTCIYNIKYFFNVLDNVGVILVYWFMLDCSGMRLNSKVIENNNMYIFTMI